MDDNKGIAIECPHCGVKVLFTPKTGEATTSYTEMEEWIGIDSKGNKTFDERPLSYEERIFVGICPHCAKPSLVGVRSIDEFPEQDYSFTCPRPTKKPDERLPRDMRRALEEIYKCDSVGALSAVAVMSRRFLENCCSAFGATQGKLPRRVEDLLRNKFPNQTLLKRAHLVRCIGDEGAHAFGDVDWDGAKATVLFCEELAHHLFITEAEFQKIVEDRKRRGKKID